jgi:hypothetical protein
MPEKMSYGAVGVFVVIIRIAGSMTRLLSRGMMSERMCDFVVCGDGLPGKARRQERCQHHDEQHARHENRQGTKHGA